MMVSAFDPAVPIDRMKERAEQSLDAEHQVPSPSSSPNHPHINSLEKGELLNVLGGKEIRPQLDEPDAEASEETEDEEVKINCIGGLSGVRDSDMSNDESSNRDEEDSEDEDMDSDAESDGERADDGVVNFVSRKVEEISPPQGVRKPTPLVRRTQNQVAFKAVLEQDDDSDTSSDSESSTSSSISSGARGIGISLETTTPASGDDLASSDDESLGDGEADSALEEESVSDDDSEMSSGSESEEEELDISDTSDVEEDDDSDDNQNQSSDDDESDSSSEELDASENDTSRDMMAIKMPLHEDNDTWNANAASEMVARSGNLRRPSFNVDEIDDIMDACQDMDGNEAFSSTSETRDKASEELNELLSDSLEFDYWSSDTLAAAVDSLASVSKEGDMSGRRDYPIRLPKRDDVEFWIDKMGNIIFSDSQLRDYLVNNPDQRVIASRIMFDAFHTEIMSLDLTQISLEKHETNAEVGELPENSCGLPRLFVGPFSAAESRLALAVLNIKRVIQISYHPLDELWVSDDVKYSTHVLPSLGNGGAPPVHAAIEEAAEEIASTLREGTPGASSSVLVTCSTGDEHSCAVCAVYLAKRLRISATAAAAQIAEQRSSCRIDPEWLRSDESSESPHGHKTKRVLSCNKLSSLNPAQGLGFGSPKRMRRVKDSSVPATMPLLPALNLGPAAHDQSRSIGATLEMRGSEEYVSSSTEEEEEREQDMRLSEELEETVGSQDDRPSTPIPLLTPPASPVRVESEEGTTTVCEWPSNLTVDSAMTAAIDLRPLSPNSLQRQEEEEKRIVSTSSCGRTKASNRQTVPTQSTLTPLIKGICVKFD